MRRFAITTGDHDGIGLEVAVKALCSLRLPKQTQFFLFYSQKSKSPYLKALRRKCDTKIFSSLSEALLTADKPGIVEIASPLSAPQWVEQCAQACNVGLLDGLCTGPMSKVLIKKSGFKDLGHTEILGRIAKQKNLYMGFLGERFHVVLASGHKQLCLAPQDYNQENMKRALKAADLLRSLLPANQKKRPIAYLGLNPHAGEKGLIGKEEMRLNGLNAKGPLVPDAAFLRQNWSKYSVFVAAYHDQGLIPFKLVHGQDSGVHITLGLPFVRTSVDHGTAKDIFNKNVANPESMRSAIEWCVRLRKRKR